MRDIGSSSSLSQQQIKRSNLTSIVNYVMTHDRATKRDICDETNLSWGLVSKVVNQYLHMGLFEEKGLASREGKGRTGAIIGIPDSASWSLGMSIRPNVIRTKVITLQGKLVEETVHAVTEKTQAGLLLSLFNALDKAFQKADEVGKTFIGIGLSSQGIIDPDQGMVESFPGLGGKAWKSTSLTQLIENRYGVPAAIESEAVNVLFALYKENKVMDAALLDLSTTVTLAYIKSGLLFSSADQLAFGHVFVPTPEGIKSLDEEASGLALEEVNAKHGSYAEWGKRAGQALAYSVYNANELIHRPVVYFSGDLLIYQNDFFPAFLAAYSSWTQGEEKNVEFHLTSQYDGAFGAALVGAERGLVESGMKIIEPKKKAKAKRKHREAQK